MEHPRSLSTVIPIPSSESEPGETYLARRIGWSRSVSDVEDSTQSGSMRSYAYDKDASTRKSPKKRRVPPRNSWYPAMPTIDDESTLSESEIQYYKVVQQLKANGSEAVGPMLRYAARRLQSEIDSGARKSVMKKKPSDDPGAKPCRICLDYISESNDVSSCACKKPLCEACMKVELNVTFNGPPHELMCTVCCRVYKPDEVEKPEKLNLRRWLSLCSILGRSRYCDEEPDVLYIVAFSMWSFLIVLLLTCSYHLAWCQRDHYEIQMLTFFADVVLCVIVMEFLPLNTRNWYRLIHLARGFCAIVVLTVYRNSERSRSGLILEFVLIGDMLIYLAASIRRDVQWYRQVPQKLLVTINGHGPYEIDPNSYNYNSKKFLELRPLSNIELERVGKMYGLL
eukprot:37738_1